MSRRARQDPHRVGYPHRDRRLARGADRHGGAVADVRVNHPIARCVALLVVICATPVVRLVACFSISAALVLSGVVEVIRGWAMPPDSPEIPTRDLRWTAPRLPR
jgi:hypothetical protein